MGSCGQFEEAKHNVGPMMFDASRGICDDGFKLAISRYRCEVCNKTKPKHTVEWPGLPRPLAVCDKCEQAGAPPLWYAVSQAALVGGCDKLSLEGLVACELAVEYHDVPMEEFYELVANEIAILDAATASAERLIAQRKGS